MLNITIPNNNIAERKYILNIFFTEFLDLDFKFKEDTTCTFWKISLENGSMLIFEDHFFIHHTKNFDYLHTNSIPKLILLATNEYILQSNIPVIYGNSICKTEKMNIHCGIDIFASAFFMLTRWEEYVNKKRDTHDRFPATESLAYKHNFLERPIVNEYVEMLKNMLRHLDKTLTFKQHIFQTKVSCDVDQPFDCTVESLGNLLRVCVGDLIKRRSITDLVKRINRYRANRCGDYSLDENYTFDWYMDACEKAGLKVAFYFIPDNREGTNGCYSLKDKKIQNLLKIINDRGHEIGVHSSYQTYINPYKMRHQKNMLEETLKLLHIKQTIRGNRQHYLRYDASKTPAYLDNAEFQYDTSGGYADSPGFRYGLCYEFSMFDFLQRTKLNLKQRPLIVMESSVIDKRYMGLEYTTESYLCMKRLKDTCKAHNGIFSLLWHNNHLKNSEDRFFFNSLLQDHESC
jgi:L,D-peptidoglycan transpeptidase YkuD (ErfK/YbiS/YcfS/YnhG family)